MFPSADKNRGAYAVLALLFAGSFAFQSIISARAVHAIFSESRHFRPEMITSWTLELFGHLLAPFASLLLGFYVASARIRDRRAWLLLAVLVSFSLNVDGANRHDEIMLWASPLKHPALVWRSFGLYTFPFWIGLFATSFPERSEWESRRPGWKWLILLPALGLSCAMAVLRIAANEIGSSRLENARDAVGVYWVAISYIVFVFFLIVLSLKLVSAQSPDSRRRVRVLLLGIALAWSPVLALGATARILHVSEDDLPGWLQIPAFLLVLLFPVTIAYVTVVQRALDVGVVIRQSLQYALARRGVIALQVIVSLVVVVWVAALAGRASFPERLAITASGIAAVLLVGFGANRLASWIDRRFFREACNAEQILNELAASVSSMVELGPLLRTVSSRVTQALHISETAVFLREQSLYRPAFCLGYAQPRDTLFSDASLTVQELIRRKEPLPVYFDAPRSWVHRVDGTEAGALRELDARLLLPLARKDDLLGFITLGPKYAEAPYSATDVNLLQSVASQTALAVENSRLASAIASETAEREVIRRELAIAREVQQRLFPQTCPQIPGLDYFGTCRPAREVGGDYYDFLELAHHNLGIAIGDVSGKGVPAALLMASLQACLRGQTIAASTSIGRLMQNINRLIYAATPGNRYATFFYGQYDPDLRRLAYVNAGHNPPVLLRKALRKPHCACECFELDVGGPPVGLMPQSEYESAYIDLQPGDVLVLFTDGFSEAMNSSDEEWCERRLIESVSNSVGRRPSEIVQELFHAADAFTAGAPQHDDMTVVVARVV